MARPRIFVSSTYYDLKHIRASLETFIESLGFEAILFERGNIPFHSDTPLDQSCYHEAENADIFVLIVGGRYGSPTSDSHHKTDQPLEEYQSITQREFNSAQKRGIPTFVLVDSAVRAEHQTYLKNREKKDIKYAHVDSVEIFHFLDRILEKPINNAVFNFEKFTQIESLLREQWAGLFRDLLRSKSQQQQLSALNIQILELQSANETLKNYLEVLVKKADPDKSDQIIRDEKEKIDNKKEYLLLRKSPLFIHIEKSSKLSEDKIKSLIENPKNFNELKDKIEKIFQNDSTLNHFTNLFSQKFAQEDYNKARCILGKPPIDFGLNK